MKKFITSILAASFILATCSINVMAEKHDRTMSIVATPNSELEVGSTVTMEVILDTTLDASSADYKISYDPKVFSIDTTEELFSPPNFYDSTWYNSISNTSSDPWGMFLGDPSWNSNTTEGWFNIGWAGNAKAKGQGVLAKYAETNRVIGKYTLTVIAVPADNKSTFSIVEANVASTKENSGDTVTKVPCTVNFKQSTPTIKDWDVTITEEADQPNGYIWKAVATPGDGKLTKFDVTFTDTNSETLTKSIADTETLGGWNTDLTFFVGLSTDKTAHPGVTAAWDIAVHQGKVNIK